MRIILFVLALLLALPAGAAITTETVPYQINGVQYLGHLAYDDAIKEPSAGILIIPEWWGLNDYIKWRARQLAELGYVAFAADMYGGGRDTGDPIQAEAWSKAARPHLRERARAALQQLANNPRVDNFQLGAIGFCFGGTSVLELAYDGADVIGVVSFHGHLPLPAEDDEINAAILVLQGSADPFVPPEDVAAWEKAMNTRPFLDWHLVSYGHAKHAFSNPQADIYLIDGVAYNQAADQRAWAHMQTFFKELFGGQMY